MKICIIKLGADGDVLRTIPLAKAIKNKHPNSIIRWITKGDISEFLKQSFIDEIFTLPYALEDEFDLLYNFDMDKEATNLAKKIKAKKKHGFYEEAGYPLAFNKGAQYYLETIFDDDLKKRNKKTYQEMMFEVAELPYEKIGYAIPLKTKDVEKAKEFFEKNNLQGKKILGIHMGASSRWPSKVWHRDRIKEFIHLANKANYSIILFGGPNEISPHSALANEIESQGVKIFRNTPDNTKGEFAALVNECSVMICSDSFALHVSLGLNKPAIGLFFCTSPHEVEGYGKLTKLISPMLFEFFPEKSDLKDEALMKSITAEEVLSTLKTTKH